MINDFSSFLSFLYSGLKRPQQMEDKHLDPLLVGWLLFPALACRWRSHPLVLFQWPSVVVIFKEELLIWYLQVFVGNLFTSGPVCTETTCVLWCWCVSLRVFLLSQEFDSSEKLIFFFHFHSTDVLKQSRLFSISFLRYFSLMCFPPFLPLTSMCTPSTRRNKFWVEDVRQLVMTCPCWPIALSVQPIMEHCSKDEGAVPGDGTNGRIRTFEQNPSPSVVGCRGLARSPKRLSSRLIVCGALDTAALQTSCRRLQLAQVAAAGIAMGSDNLKVLPNSYWQFKIL